MAIPPSLVHVAEHVDPASDLAAAARRMEEWSIGSLVVVEDGRPVGIVTDRDIALHVLERELDPTATPVSECMNHTLVALTPEASITDAIDRMREHGIRRLPMIGADGELVGIVTADDLLMLLAQDLSQLAAVIRRGIVREGTETRPPSSIFGKE